MRVALDTNVLAYAEGLGDQSRCGRPAFQAALDLNVDHKLQIWDALILAVAAEQHCRILLTEDMHAGFTWRGVTLVNPFAPEIDPLLEQLLA